MRLPLVIAPLVIACGGDGVPGVDAGFAEAMHPSVPQVMTNGGPILRAPEIVPIFFPNDPLQSDIEAFLHTLATSSYWTATTSEYGVGAPIVLPSIVSTATPPTTDDALRGLLEAYFGPPVIEPRLRSPDGWPRPDASTLYVVFLPAGVTLTAGSDVSCRDFGGYHDETADARIVYALLPRCPTMRAPIDAITPALSHELIEAATDPHPESAPGWLGVDNDDLIWDFTPGGELGDMCEYAGAAYQRLVGNYRVQRSWSNAAAAAGHDPCVPALATPYVAAAPVVSDVVLSYGTGSMLTRGVKVPLGETRTIDVELFSDAETTGWTIGADDVASVLMGMPAELSVMLDRTTGNNGDTLALTIARVKNGDGGGSEFVVTSKVNGTTVALWWGLATD